MIAQKPQSRNLSIRRIPHPLSTTDKNLKNKTGFWPHSLLHLARYYQWKNMSLFSNSHWLKRWFLIPYSFFSFDPGPDWQCSLPGVPISPLEGTALVWILESHLRRNPLPQGPSTSTMLASNNEVPCTSTTNPPFPPIISSSLSAPYYLLATDPKTLVGAES